MRFSLISAANGAPFKILFVSKMMFPSFFSFFPYPTIMPDIISAM